MIIMLEGVDGSGKSTLKKELIARLVTLQAIKKVKVIADGETLIQTHPLKSDRLPKLELANKLRCMLEDKAVIYICDRGPISDVIYRTFDNYQPVLSLLDLFIILLQNTNNIICVHCDTPTAYNLMSERGDDNPIAIEKHKELQYLFNQIMPLFSPIKYDLSTGKTPGDMASFILALLWKSQIGNKED